MYLLLFQTVELHIERGPKNHAHTNESFIKLNKKTCQIKGQQKQWHIRLKNQLAINCKIQLQYLKSAIHIESPPKYRGGIKSGHIVPALLSSVHFFPHNLRNTFATLKILLYCLKDVYHDTSTGTTSCI